MKEKDKRQRKKDAKQIEIKNEVEESEYMEVKYSEKNGKNHIK